MHNVITTADLNQKVDGTKFVNYPWGTYDQNIMVDDVDMLSVTLCMDVSLSPYLEK